MSLTERLKRGLESGIAELAIARPDEHKQQLLYKHPDHTVPAKARLTVGADEVALFFRDGAFAGRFEAGKHVLDSDTIPFLGQLIDRYTGGDVFRAELFFVSRLEFTGLKFGGRIGKMRDPESGLAVETMVHGTFSLRVIRPEHLVTTLTGMGHFDSQGFYAWFREQVLKTLRDHLAELCVKRKWPLLDVTSGAYTQEVEQAVLETVRAHCGDYGIEIVRLGNFHVGINKSDEKRLEDFYEKAAYIRLAGGLDGYDKMAAADMKRGAAEGFAHGGGGAGGGSSSGLLEGAGLGVGLAFAQQMASPQQRSAQSAEANLPGHHGASVGSPASHVSCSACAASVPLGKFCSECGTPMNRPKFCSECGAKVSGKFCSECGTSASA